VAVVIEILGMARGESPFPLPAWIQDFDDKEGLLVTGRIEDAKRFKDNLAAWDFYRQELPNGVMGFNPSGKNRPLTAFTVTIYKEEDRK
jgi:hypothetical protein